MTLAVSTLSVLIGILIILQGWQVVVSKRNRNNHVNTTDDCLSAEQMRILTDKLGEISSQLTKINMRMNDIWNKLNQ